MPRFVKLGLQFVHIYGFAIVKRGGKTESQVILSILYYNFIFLNLEVNFQ